MIDVVNLQRKISIDTSTYRDFVQTLPAFIKEASGKTFSVAFVSDRRMSELNKFFRGKDSTTDVLSFPHEPDDFGSSPYEGGAASASDDGVVLSDANFLGDIVISTEQAHKQAAENGLDLQTEIKQLILHGVLHLCGYDHETDNGEMNAYELQLRENLSL